MPNILPWPLDSLTKRSTSFVKLRLFFCVSVMLLESNSPSLGNSVIRPDFNPAAAQTARSSRINSNLDAQPAHSMMPAAGRTGKPQTAHSEPLPGRWLSLPILRNRRHSFNDERPYDSRLGKCSSCSCLSSSCQSSCTSSRSYS
jgi:hypothetical protein